MLFEEVEKRILNLKAQKPLVWDAQKPLVWDAQELLVWDPVNRKFTFRRNVIIDLKDIDLIFKQKIRKKK